MELRAMAATCHFLKPWEAPSHRQQLLSSRAGKGLAFRRPEVAPSSWRIKRHSEGLPRCWLACRAVGRTEDGGEYAGEGAGEAGQGGGDLESRRRERERAEEEEILRALNLDPEDLEEDDEREGGAENVPFAAPAADMTPETSSGDVSPVADGKQGKRRDEEELGKALNLNEIPESSTQFLAMVSSPAYKMRHRLEQSLTATEFDVVEANPWRETDKAVYVLANQDEQLYTMRTRRPQREVEHELDLLFFRRRNHSQNHASNRGGTHSSGPSQGTRTMEGMGSMGIPEHSTSVSHGSGSSGSGSTGDARLRRSSGSSSSSKNASGSMGRAGGRGAFRVHVEDVREGILVFEDEAEASQYCRVLGGDSNSGAECVGVAQFRAAELFKVCEKSKALAVVFKRGSMPPSPEYLRHTLRARKQSLEDLES